MSTRSIVAKAAEDGFVDGVYVHSDGYPTARGPVLFELASALGSPAELWRVLDSAHNGGWSYLDPRYVRSDSYLGDRGQLVPGVGERYTDVQMEDDWRFAWHGTSIMPSDGWAEWAYAIEPDAGTLAVHLVRNGTAVPLAVVRFGDEVDWEAIEEAGAECLGGPT